MKKILILLLVSFGGLAQNTIRVTAGQRLQAAIDNATAGDVLVVEGGLYDGNLIINKRVILQGTGYFLLASSQAVQNTAKITGSVFFRNGAAGAVLQGFEINGTVDVSTSNVAILRNYIKAEIRVGLNEASDSYNGTCNNVSIKQNFIKRLVVISRLEQGILGNAQNFICKNNIISQGFHLQGNISGVVINNTFDCDIVGDEYPNVFQTYISQIQLSGGAQCGKQNIVFKNNILSNIGNWGQDWCAITNYPTDVFKYNILQGTSGNYTVPSDGLSPTNLIISDLNQLYQGYPNNPNSLPLDARNQLAPNSPAKGAGEGGTDAGAFGGDDPYVLSGIPNIPSIYQLTVPAQVPQNGTLNVTIKAKTNN